MHCQHETTRCTPSRESGVRVKWEWSVGKWSVSMKKGNIMTFKLVTTLLGHLKCIKENRLTCVHVVRVIKYVTLLLSLYTGMWENVVPMMLCSSTYLLK